MSKGIDVYIDSGVHVEGFTKLTDEAKEIAKQKFIDAIQNNQLDFYLHEMRYMMQYMKWLEIVKNMEIDTKSH